MPKEFEDLPKTHLHLEAHPVLVGTGREYISHRFSMKSVSIFYRNNQETPTPFHEEHPEPPLELQLWNFVLRYYLIWHSSQELFGSPNLIVCGGEKWAEERSSSTQVGSLWESINLGLYQGISDSTKFYNLITNYLDITLYKHLDLACRSGKMWYAH